MPQGCQCFTHSATIQLCQLLPNVLNSVLSNATLSKSVSCYQLPPLYWALQLSPIQPQHSNLYKILMLSEPLHRAARLFLLLLQEWQITIDGYTLLPQCQELSSVSINNLVGVFISVLIELQWYRDTAQFSYDILPYIWSYLNEIVLYYRTITPI